MHTVQRDMSLTRTVTHTAKHRPRTARLPAPLSCSFVCSLVALHRCHSSTITSVTHLSSLPSLSLSLSLYLSFSFTHTHTQTHTHTLSLTLSLSAAPPSHSTLQDMAPTHKRPAEEAMDGPPSSKPCRTCKPVPSSYHFTLIDERKVVCVGPDSFLITDFLTNAEATKYFTRLQDELGPRYVPRNNPALQFKIFNKVNQLPRDKAFLGDVENGTTPQYRYNPPGNDQYPEVQEWTPATKELRDKLCQLYNQYTNHLVANRYMNGQDHIGLHHDKDRDFESGSSVLTVSFGQERRFELKLINKPNDGGIYKAKIQLVLPHGSVFVLGPITNKLYKHSIVKETSKTRTVLTRISLTYRSIARIINKETNEVVAPIVL